MTPETFDAVLASFDDAIVMLAPNGVIRAINRSATAEIVGNDAEDLRQRNLSEFVTDPQRKLLPLLRSARRTSGQSIGSLRFSQTAEPIRVYLQRIGNWQGEQRFLLMRMAPRHDAIKQFATLSEKVSQLNGEISRRRAVEQELRLQRDVAAFGRDIGVALVHSHHLYPALIQCTQLMVDRLGAAFARIWLADEAGEKLELVASSGMYTHLDGVHSRIAFGEFKIGRIAAQQQPHVTNEVVGDQEVHNQEWARQEGMVAFAGYPLIDGGKTVGVMGLFARHALSESVAAAMASVANTIALRIRKQSIEDGLAAQTLALREADRRKDEFLAMLSHELRNPLAPVRSGLDLLAMEELDQHDTVALMQQQVEHLVRLVDDLLDVSRIMRGKVQLKKSDVSLSDSLTQAIASLADALQDRSLEIMIPDTPIYVRADKVRIKQVIENLIKNACKYSDSGARICVEISREGDVATVHVRDNGMGIDPTLLPHLFDLFAQAPRTLDRSQGGLGIGLTLVKSLVELHGGNVWAASEGLGKGSVFSFCLPTCVGDPSQVEAIPEVDGPLNTSPCRPLRILAVDDNRSAQLMIARLFEKLGSHQVVTADDGPSAIQRFTEFNPDLMLLDIGLPGMDGYAVAKAIHQLSPEPRCLIVALTGYGRKEDRDKSRASGFDLHLVKPLGVQELRELLQHPKLNTNGHC